MRGLGLGRNLGLGLSVIFAAAMAGCAREPDTGFSRLGATDVNFTADDADVADTSVQMPADPAVNSAMRHVKSNKVLGAMAFQKVTGRTVDPSRLTGEQQ